MTLVNDLYNWYWITQHRLQADPEEEDQRVDLTNKGSDSNGEGVSWLRNLKRLVEQVAEKETLSDLSFVDIGAGTGITAIYAATVFDFKSVEGFDFEQNLIDIANRNLKKRVSKSLNCRFYVGNATNIQFELHGRSVFYIANSFGVKTMESFLNNNLRFIQKNHSYIAICNDHLANYLKEVPELKMIWRSAKYNCSLFSAVE